jgi:hypothetical protein
MIILKAKITKEYTKKTTKASKKPVVNILAAEPIDDFEIDEFEDEEAVEIVKKPKYKSILALEKEDSSFKLSIPTRI